MNNGYVSGLSNSKEIGIKINFTYFFVIFTFVLTETFRGMFNERFGWINFPFLVTMLVYLGISVIRGKIKPSITIVVLLFSGLVLINTEQLHKGISYNEMTFANLLAPLFLLTFKISPEQALKTLKIFLGVFNPLIFTLTSLGIIDYLTHSSIQLWLANHGSPLSDLIHLEHSWGIYRYYSFIGHPLTNAEYFLMFFILNSIYARYEKPLIARPVISIITIVGLLLSASKTALVLGLLLLIFFNGIKKGKWLYFFLTVGALVIFFNTSFFQNNLGARFAQGLQTGDITSGRDTLLATLMQSGAPKPSFFVGGGADYSREVAQSLNGNIQNFEYPFLMLPYDYGILGAFIIYFIILFYPVYRLLKNKNFYILALFLILSVMINTNNGLANLGSDTLKQLCFICFMLINLGSKKNIPDKN